VHSDVVRITSQPPTTVQSPNVLTISPPLWNGYNPANTTVEWGYQYLPPVPTAGVVTLPSQNYGLATLYYLYLSDAKSYLRTPQMFHCPTLTDTEDINRNANLSAVNVALTQGVSKDTSFSQKALLSTYNPTTDPLYRSFDPVWSGYNTYDATYNYDMNHNNILLFDAALGYGNINYYRQLHAPNPPADTVVCYCYGHAGSTPATVDFSAPAATWTTSSGLTPDALVANTEHMVAPSTVYLVLWLDGTVLPVRPYLMQQYQPSTSPTSLQYYWVPPFLYTQGDAHP
jgi:hypothetical protein